MGDKAYGLVVFKKDKSYTLKFFNHISALLDGESEDVNIRVGDVIKVYVKKLRKGKARMEVTLTKQSTTTSTTESK